MTGGSSDGDWVGGLPGMSDEDLQQGKPCAECGQLLPSGPCNTCNPAGTVVGKSPPEMPYHLLDHEIAEMNAHLSNHDSFNAFVESKWSDWLVNVSKVDIDRSKGQKIGEGAYGGVYRVKGNATIVLKLQTELNDLRKFSNALKEAYYSVNLRDIGDQQRKNEGRHENWPYIVKSVGKSMFYSTNDSPYTICMVTVITAAEEDLLVNIKRNGSDLNMRLKWIRQLSEALEFLHGNSVIHRDIKLENILVSGGDIAVADFGFLSDDLFSESHRIGSPPYMAPEVLARKPHSPAMDMWSFGCVVHVLLTDEFFLRGTVDQNNAYLEQVWNSPQNLADHSIYKEHIKGMLVTNMIQKHSQETLMDLEYIVDIFVGCMMYDPVVRFTAKEVVMAMAMKDV